MSRGEVAAWALDRAIGQRLDTRDFRRRAWVGWRLLEVLRLVDALMEARELRRRGQYFAAQRAAESARRAVPEKTTNNVEGVE